MSSGSQTLNHEQLVELLAAASKLFWCALNERIASSATKARSRVPMSPNIRGASYARGQIADARVEADFQWGKINTATL